MSLLSVSVLIVFSQNIAGYDWEKTIPDKSRKRIEPITDKITTDTLEAYESNRSEPLSANRVVEKTIEKFVPKYVQDFVGTKTLAIKSSLSIGFESVHEFKDFYIVPQHYQGAANHDLSDEVAIEGKKAHKAWIYKAYKGKKGFNNNHRAYPTIQMNKTFLGIIQTKALIEFHVYADVELTEKADQNWLSLATFTSYSDIHWPRSYLVNVDRNYRLHLMHVPYQGLKAPDIASNMGVILPKKEWSKITVYIDYEWKNRFDSPFIAIWQNGVLASATRFNDRINPQRLKANEYPSCLKSWEGQSVAEAERLCKLSYESGLAQMHFGMYAPPKVERGVIYNDNLVISQIREIH